MRWPNWWAKPDCDAMPSESHTMNFIKLFFAALCTAWLLAACAVSDGLPKPQALETKSLEIDFSRGLSLLLADFECELIKKALAIDPDVDKASNLLQISRSSLYKKMK